MYITSLDAESAQKIADRIMQIIPYNINMSCPTNGQLTAL